jgi:hypothetical protein
VKLLIIGNLSDTRCGFQNFTQQTVTALGRCPDVEVTAWDGTYEAIYQRHQKREPVFFPADVARYDVVHLIWNAMTMNHYSGADWAGLAALPGGGPLVSWWDGGPSDASCPFLNWMRVRWSDYPRDGYHYGWYPVPDWVEDLPPAADQFTVGASSVRGDGVSKIRQICEAEGWALNLPTPGAWLPLDAEIRRLAHSTVNVCWYQTPPIWKNRASAPSMLIAARRPVVINRDPLVAHLWDAADLYHSRTLAPLLGLIAQQHAGGGRLTCPLDTYAALSWTRAAADLLAVWSTYR